MKLILTIVLLIFSIENNAQTINCDLLIDPEYKGVVLVYDKPSGNETISVKHDFINQDFLTLTVIKETQDYFYGILQFAISERKTKGWLRKSKYIGTFARNYHPKFALKLYSNPSYKSKLNSIVPTWTNQIYQVTSINKDWVYVKLNYKGKLKQGWLSPDMQCPNPYSTCN